MLKSPLRTHGNIVLLFYFCWELPTKISPPIGNETRTWNDRVLVERLIHCVTGQVVKGLPYDHFEPIRYWCAWAPATGTELQTPTDRRLLCR